MTFERGVWPKVDDRYFICNRDHPMPFPQPENTQWIHPDSKGENHDDDPYYDHYRCPNCNLHFKIEVPE